MIPVLVMGGRKLKVAQVNYRDNKVNNVMTVDENDNFVTYYDKSVGFADDSLRVDMNEVLIWEGRYKPIKESLNAHLEDSEQYLQELKNRIANEILTNTEEIPFPHETKEIKILADEHRNHKVYIEGITAAIEIVDECEVSFTDEDEEDLRWLGKSINVPKEFWGSKNEKQS